MSKMVIVPDGLALAINTKLDSEIARHPDAAKDREFFYNELLLYFDEHGVVPDFSIERKETQ